MYDYIAFSDHRFTGFAKNELISLFSGHSYSESNSINQDQFFVFSLDIDPEKALSIIKQKGTVFVDNIIPIIGMLDSIDKDFENVARFIAKNISKNETFRIEVKSLWSHLEDHAKSIEVLLGKQLESEGFAVNLVEPDVFLYVILIDGKPIIGRIARNETASYIIDSFRVTNNSEETISRSMFKLIEAIDYFNVNLDEVKLAIDIGAAPGGWISHVASKGVRAVAVDNALLDYKKLEKNNKILVASKDEIKLTNIDSIKLDAIKKFEQKYNILHIKANIEEIKMETLKEIGGFDLLLIDMNVSPTETAEIACKLSEALNPGASAIITIKLIDENVYKHIDEVQSIVSKEYKSFKVKKLPHNRMELTCFVVKK